MSGTHREHTVVEGVDILQVLGLVFQENFDTNFRRKCQIIYSSRAVAFGLE